ncbi:MAG: WYL domain-containing protein, partial [Bacteroidota bacterium]
KTSCYFYEGANIPPLNHLSEEEQMTLPFLTSLLDPYQEVPAFTKFLKEVSTLFDQDLQKIDTLHAFSISGPKFSLPEKRARMVTNMLILLKHIHRREIIKFKYYTSTSFNSKREESEKPKLFKLKPICVRLYQGLYYLTGVTDNKKQQLLNFRIDNIVQDSIMTEWVSKDVFKVKTFELNATLVEVDFNNKLSRALGIWIHDENSKEEKITIRFYSWAAKYALLFNLHPTQKLICLDEKEEYADFEFCLYTSDAHIAKVNAITKKYLVDVKQGKSNADNRPYIEWMNKFPEAGYLFGRFINFIELL